MTNERQAELDRWVDELERVLEGIKDVLYDGRQQEQKVRLDPMLAFLIGSLWAANRLRHDQEVQKEMIDATVP